MEGTYEEKGKNVERLVREKQEKENEGKLGQVGKG